MTKKKWKKIRMILKIESYPDDTIDMVIRIINDIFECKFNYKCNKPYIRSYHLSYPTNILIGDNICRLCEKYNKRNIEDKQ